jgi:thioredoxin 1
MENSPEEGNFKKHGLKIIIPILIIIVIGAIWFMKNPGKQLISGNKEESGGSSAKNTEFALLATDELDIKKLKSYGLPIMIDFGADSCIPCKEMAPVLVKLNEKLQGKAIIKFVDVWKNKKLAEGYPIRVIPTQVFFDKDGKPYKPSAPQASQMNMYSLKDNNEHVFTTHEGVMTEAMILAALKEMGLKE